MAAAPTLPARDWPIPVHSWLRSLDLAMMPKTSDPVLRSFCTQLAEEFTRQGHTVRTQPDSKTELIFTTAPFREALNWRSAMLFTARRNFGLQHTPTIITILRATPENLSESLAEFERILKKDPPDPGDYRFPGLAPQAFRTLHEQGNRGGPIMALARLLQSQAKSIRIILVVGEQQPEFAYIFDLVGAHPRIEADNRDFFYTDIVLRLATTMSTAEITNHKLVEPPISRQTWNSLATPNEMIRAASELGKRRFFTEMVMVSNLVHVPSIDHSVASQYSEGCFATYDPAIQALLATVTGSARPVEKDAIGEDDLAVIVGVRPSGAGAVVRHVEAKQNDPPSSESVEMMEMDAMLPRIVLPAGPYQGLEAPVVRSKLHGHRGVRGYDPALVEFVPLDPPYYHYPVSCATDAQARGIVQAFSRSEALKNPADSRNAVFTVLPGHGLVVVEKWVPGKVAFEHLIELMDAGGLKVENRIPQGIIRYHQTSGHWMEIEGGEGI